MLLDDQDSPMGGIIGLLVSLAGSQCEPRNQAIWILSTTLRGGGTGEFAKGDAVESSHFFRLII